MAVHSINNHSIFRKLRDDDTIWISAANNLPLYQSVGNNEGSCAANVLRGVGDRVCRYS